MGTWVQLAFFRVYVACMRAAFVLLRVVLVRVVAF